jgi:hypothetical protein
VTEQRLAVFREEIFVEALELKGAARSYPHVVLDHQVGQLIAIDQDDALSQMLRKFESLTGERGGCDKHSLCRAQSDETSDEPLHFWTADWNIRRIPFGLHVYAVKTETIFVDNAINAPITTLPKLRGSVSMGSAVSHRDKKIDDQLFEE